LDAHIIEELRRQEERRRAAEEDRRPRIDRSPPPEAESPSRGSDDLDRDEDATEVILLRL
jgi:hypothetical protein